MSRHWPFALRGRDVELGGFADRAGLPPSNGVAAVLRQRDESADGAGLDPALFELFEHITRRLDAGEAVDEERLVADHPAWTEEIRGLMPTLREIAGAAERHADGSGPASLSGDLGGRRLLGDFRIVREIGRGGMGIVYEAEQPELGRRVALKALSWAAALDPRAIQRFRLEAQVVGWLQHPRIVPIYAVGVADDVPYFAMQYIEGKSLSALILEMRRLAEQRACDAGGCNSREGAPQSPSELVLGLLSGRFARQPSETRVDDLLPALTTVDDRPSSKLAPSIRDGAYLRTVARLAVQAAQALAYAHEQGIVHRDIKPANLLLDRRGDLWVADFGMAEVQGSAGLTLSGDLPGTLRYMSPEQASGQRALVDRRTDIYSLGVTLYELLTLQPAVTAEDKVGIIRQIIEDEPVPIRRLNSAVPVDLATIVTKAIAKDPSGRYETTEALAADLGRFLEGRPIAARPVGLFTRSWRWCRRKPVQAGRGAWPGLHPGFRGHHLELARGGAPKARSRASEITIGGVSSPGGNVRKEGAHARDQGGCHQPLPRRRINRPGRAREKFGRQGDHASGGRRPGRRPRRLVFFRSARDGSRDPSCTWTNLSRLGRVLQERAPLPRRLRDLRSKVR
jgi:eukaryotic-like serine/threonine-protein kinase